MHLHDGWVADVKHVPSPHFDERPMGEAPSLLVIHNISLPPGQFGGPWVDQLFTGTLVADAHPYFKEISRLRVSAHCFIRRDGTLVQYVPFHLRAWHAGVSCFQGREKCNDYSIGIELEGTDTLAYTEAQYQTLTAVTRLLMQHYPLLREDRIIGHCDIAPGRKTDPGPAFSWQKFHCALAGEEITSGEHNA